MCSQLQKKSLAKLSKGEYLLFTYELTAEMKIPQVQSNH